MAIGQAGGDTSQLVAIPASCGRYNFVCVSEGGPLRLRKVKYMNEGHEVCSENVQN